MVSLGQHMLALRASVFWSAALCVPLVFHCVHLARGCVECRWLHGVHLVMLIGMLYMYASLAFDVSAVPTGAWLALYVVSSAAVLAWMALRLLKGGSVGHLWILALVQQIAMIYMWAPMSDWVPAVSYGLAFYFALETLGWAMKGASRGAGGALILATGGPAPAPNPEGSLLDDACMTVMAASMAYMFLGMQLMMSTPRQPEQLAEHQYSAPSQAPINSGDAYKPEALAKTPKVAVAEPVTAALETPEPMESYTIVGGDSLRSIAARHYGSARHWHRIAKANPRLNPLRLRIGRVIKLPRPLYSR